MTGVLKKLAASRKAAMTAISDVRGLITDQRNVVSDLCDELRKLEQRPHNQASSLDAVAAGIQQLAERGDYLLRLAARGANGNGDTPPFFSLSATDPDDAVALLVVANPELVKSLVNDRLATLRGEDAGLTDAERDAERDRINGEIIAAELVEEMLIREAKRSGITIARRANQRHATALAFDAELPT